MAVATHGRFEWMGCSRWESAGFDGSILVDLMEGASMIQGNCLNDSGTDNTVSFMREEERVSGAPAFASIYRDGMFEGELVVY